MALPKYALYAWRQTAAQEAGSSMLSWGIWRPGCMNGSQLVGDLRLSLVKDTMLLVVLEVASIFAFLQVAVLTNTVFVAVPLGLLFANAAIRARQLGQKMSRLTEPLVLCWPASHSRLGFCRSQAPAGRFVLCGVLLQVACLACFWLDNNAWPLFSHHVQRYCPEYLLPERSDCGNGTYAELCLHMSDNTGMKGQVDTIQSFKRTAGGSCRDLCDGDCGPTEKTTRAGGGYEAILVRRYQLSCTGCQGRCCRCLACQLSSTLPQWQRDICSTGAFNYRLATDFIAIAHNEDPNWHLLQEQWASWTSSNALSVVLARCALAHTARSDGWPAPEGRLEGWFAIASLLLVCPVVALALRVVVSLALPKPSVGHLWTAPCDEDMLRSLEQEAEKVRHDIAKGTFKASMKQKVELYREFGLFLADYLSDYYTLVELLLAQQWQFGVAQALIIAVPMAFDCLRGKVQLVEVVVAFACSRKKGIPTNELILALRSEKGVEAPMSMCLTYLCLFQATSLSSFASRLASLLLSIINISKYVYTTFELGLLEVIEASPSQEALAETIGDPSQPRPVLTSPPPDLPRGIMPPVIPVSQMDMPKADLPPGIIFPRRKSRESCVAPLPPITVEDQKLAEKE